MMFQYYKQTNFMIYKLWRKQSQRLEERMAYAFLLNTAIQRQAERVTAQRNSLHGKMN